MRQLRSTSFFCPCFRVSRLDARVRPIFVPPSTNVWGADYPQVDNTGRVQIRVKAPDATKVKLNFWSGPKVDMDMARHWESAIL